MNQDVTLNEIDYNWIDNCNKPKLLKKAYQLLKDDGGYFPHLETQIEEKLYKIDKTFKKIDANENVSRADIEKANKEILDWEENIKKPDKLLSSKSEVIILI